MTLRAVPDDPFGVPDLPSLVRDALDRGETLRSLRHAFGTVMYQRTLDLRAVQEEMGHRTPKTTEVYTRVANRARAAAVEAAAELQLDQTA